MSKRKGTNNDIQKHYTENLRSNSTNPTKNGGAPER